MIGAGVRHLTWKEALCEALILAMQQNPRVVCFGDLRAWNDPPNNIAESFPERVFYPPVSETAYIGAATGLALAGWRPFCDLSTSSFMFTGFDQVVNEATNFRYMSGGRVSVPVVYRILSGAGGGEGAQHAHSPERWLISVPGLKVVKPSNPYDVKGLFLAAVDDNNPVVLVDHRKLEGISGPVPGEPYTLDLGKAEIRRTGSDLTIIAAGFMVHEALRAADRLLEDGVDTEVVDLRSLKPLDRTTICQSVTRTGRALVVDESPEAASVASEVAAVIADQCFSSLKAPVRRVCTPDTPMPFSPVLERLFVPNAGGVVAAARALLGQAVTKNGG